MLLFPLRSSSFRDSTYTDQDFGGPGGDDASDNGIDHVFEGKFDIPAILHSLPSTTFDQ